MLLNILKPEVYLSNGIKFAFYCKENTTYIQYKINLLVAFREIITAHFKNQAKHINPLCEENAVLLNV
jgi:hypothetical protein